MNHLDMKGNSLDFLEDNFPQVNRVHVKGKFKTLVDENEYVIAQYCKVIVSYVYSQLLSETQAANYEHIVN